MTKITYPESRRCDHVDDYHGTQVADPYRWLEDLNSQETADWISAQNAVTVDFLADIPARAKIEARLTELWDFAKVSAPFRRNGRYFQFRNTGLQNQDVLYTMGSYDGEGRVLIDPNTLSEDGTVALSSVGASPDGRWMAYATSGSGSDWKTWHIRNVETGRDLDDELSWSKFSGVEWLADSGGFVYCRYPAPEEGAEYDSANFGQQVCLHRLSTPQSADEILYERHDEPKRLFSPIVTDDGEYVVIEVRQSTDRRNRVVYRRLAGGAFAELVPIGEAQYHFVGSTGPVFYFQCDLDAANRTILAIDTRTGERTTLVPEGADAIQYATMVHDEFVAITLHSAYHQIKRYGLDGTPLGDIPLPGIGSIGPPHGSREDSELFFAFSSFTVPATAYRFDFETRETQAVSAPALDFDTESYVTEQITTTSKDGTRFPIFLVHRKDLVRDGQNPTLLYGYGGFNIPETPKFMVQRLVWLEMGGVLAVATLRGGGEFGEAWHEAGTVHNKQNVFDDFISAAEHLIATGITSTPKLAIEGRSNGGLLVGACMTQRPELFGATLPTVGVMDMLRFHKFTIGWAWVSDYGCADDPEQFKTLLAYSPLHNARPAVYPPTLISTGDHDDRVMPAHSFKFAAAMQAAQQGDAPMLIRVQTKTGHGADKPTALLIEERADMWGFLYDALGMG